MTTNESIPPQYFEAMYAKADDPWGFSTRPYEAAKYAATINALADRQYVSAFEVGCSIGVLSEQLARVADALLAVDVSARALDLARERCRELRHVRFERMRLPRQFPDDFFELVVISEVGYYWSRADLVTARDLIFEHLLPGGDVLLVHWLPRIADAPLTGDEVHDLFMECVPLQLRHITGQRAALYRLDLFRSVR